MDTNGAVLSLVCLALLSAASLCPERCDCPHAQHILCANRGLRAVPRAPTSRGSVGAEMEGDEEEEEEEEKEVRSLSLGGNFIANISAVDFARYGGLVRLSMQYNQIHAVHPGAFQPLRELRELYLGHNLLSTLPPAALRPLGKLTVLYGNDNTLSAVPPMAPLRSLVKLRLDGNAIEQLPDGAFRGLAALQSLQLEGNRLQRIHGDAFNGLSRLRFLNLSDNELPALEAGAFRGLRRLAALSLSNNEIARLEHGALRGLAAVRRLWLDGNALEELPAGPLDPLGRVEELDLSRNWISRVAPAAFARLGRLKVLRLRGNRLASPPGPAAFAPNDLPPHLDLHGNNNWTCDDCGPRELTGALPRCNYPESRGGKDVEQQCRRGGGGGGGWREEGKGEGLPGRPVQREGSRPGKGRGRGVSTAVVSTVNPLPTLPPIRSRGGRVRGRASDPCVLIANVTADRVTPDTATVRWAAHGVRGGRVRYRVQFDRLGAEERFPRYVDAAGGAAAHSVHLRELSASAAYLVCVEAVWGGAPSCPRCTGLATPHKASPSSPAATGLQLVTVATLAANAVLLLAVGGAWLGRAARRRLRRRRSAVHVRHMYSSAARRPIAMATADFAGYRSAARLAPPEGGDLIRFPGDRFLDDGCDMGGFSD